MPPHLIPSIISIDVGRAVTWPYPYQVLLISRSWLNLQSFPPAINIIYNNDRFSIQNFLCSFQGLQIFFLNKPALLFTARKRSLGQGNIFIGVCQEFCSQGGCLLQGVCLLPGGVSAPGGCLVETPPDGYCGRWYASYWNAFLFYLENILQRFSHGESVYVIISNLLIQHKNLVASNLSFRYIGSVLVDVQVHGLKQLRHHAGYQKVSRCRTRGESEESFAMNAMKHTSKGIHPGFETPG